MQNLCTRLLQRLRNRWMILREYDLSEQDWPECRSEHFLPFKTAFFILSFIL
ncbi:hypothetical protein AB434_2430 [Heyndrickxia coagulans]|uniref:Uncharacterized protein n=1 Tax=Heyndrickxia coagulans TaxID=1398 RepID=A0AAN0T822_HEYCO|nr:hypothetical protein SB48_HM08orf04585 [Heyndrickxia coagulans]AKN54835.1 hypothetical protein AB434_2430 [Heyndrickxia coagulans]